ncbi:Transcriptional regulator SlyA [Planctomycetales bacterium 10988]|nr:Transcriptional regulator SlyA [Planctomycetales bacterium 10988]
MKTMAFAFESTIGFWVNRTAYLMRGYLRQEFRQVKQPVTPEEWSILVRLWQEDGRRPSDLADLTIRDATTVTRLLDSLSRKGLVERRPDSEDRRVVRAWLTSTGRELEEKLVPQAIRMLEIACQDIPEDEIETTMRTLQKMQDNLSQNESSS